MDTKTQRVELLWDRIQEHLQRKKAHIVEEISNYPTPIAGCDQQFNYLLEQRSAIAGEWARLQKATTESFAAEDPLNVIEEFIRSSSYLDAKFKESICQDLQAHFAGRELAARRVPIHS